VEERVLGNKSLMGRVLVKNGYGTFGDPMRAVAKDHGLAFNYKDEVSPSVPAMRTLSSLMMIPPMWHLLCFLSCSETFS